MDNQTQPLGVALVVPKRHTRRSVTRALIKRQMREALQRHFASLSTGRLLISQRAAFDPQQYPSAASLALRAAVRRELDNLFEQAASR